jgi:solute carrier family 26 (sodium-independent sulfate anion transporter), member 11
MAYSKLADLPVQYGLYTSFVGGITYWVFGSSKDVSIGPVAVASIITGAIIADIANEHPTEPREVLAGTIAMLAGAVFTALGVLRLGWLVDMLSLPAVTAFITGSAITICFGQFPVMMGIRHISGRDPAFKIGLNIFKNLGRIRIDAALGLTSLLLLYSMKWICSWVAKKRPNLAKAMFFISTLRTVVTIVLYTIISYIINRNRKDNPLVRILGFVPRGQACQIALLISNALL